MEQFSKLLGAKPSIALFKQMLQQFDDIRHFLTVDSIFNWSITMVVCEKKIRLRSQYE